MHALKNTLVGSAGVVVLSVVVALSSFGQARAVDPAPVLVTNSGAAQAVPVVSVDNPARQPFQFTKTMDWNQGDFIAGCSSCFVVPSGKRLTIEFFSAFIVLPFGERVSDCVIFFGTIAGGTAGMIPHFFVPIFTGTTSSGTRNALDSFVISQDMRMYAEPATAFSFNTSRTTGSGGGSVVFSLSGYLLDVP